MTNTAFTALTSSASNQWNTPKNIIRSASKVMGGIHCDPATNAYSQKFIQAPRWFDGSCYELDGLHQVWFDPDTGIMNVFVNPPYGELAKLFCYRMLILWRKYGRMGCQMIVLVRGDNDGLDSLLRFCNYWVRMKRIKFIPSPELELKLKEDAAAKNKKWVNSPVPGSITLYFGHKGEEFKEEFSQYGQLFLPALNL